MGRGCNEKDWKLFRSKIAGWQEEYMDRLTKEYIELLSSDKEASEKFWELEKRIKEDKRKTGVIVHMSRSEMSYHLRNLLVEGAICMKDLEDFSDELKDEMQTYQELWKKYADDQGKDVDDV